MALLMTGTWMNHLNKVTLIFFCVFFVGNASFSMTRQEYVNSVVSQAEQYSKQEGRQSLAVSLINEAIKLQPRNPELYYKRAFILGRAGQYLYAIPDLNMVMKLKQYPHAIRFRADCFMAVRDYQKAAQDYSVFLGSAPKDGKVWSYLAEALALQGNKQAALEATSRGLATGSHWSERLRQLQEMILLDKIIVPHKPFSN